MIMTVVNPQAIARSVAKPALTTEAQPLIPQAQGTSDGAPAATRCRPRGKGRPIANASGASSMSETVIFTGGAYDMNAAKTGGKRSR